MAAGIAVRKEIVSGIEIQEEAHGLSQESASGFRLLLSNPQSIAGIRSAGGGPAVLILPGLRDLSPTRCRELLGRAQAGSWLILEAGVCFSSPTEARAQANILKNSFGLEVLPPVSVPSMNTNRCPYVSYTWPVQQSLRTYEAITPLCCKRDEAIAFFERQPVCAKKRVGQGGILYLGTMLGPGLFAEEREAHAVGNGIFAR